MTERLYFHFSLSCIGEGNGNPLQCSCLENPRDGGAWWAAVYGVAPSRTQLKQLSSSSSRCTSEFHKQVSPVNFGSALPLPYLPLPSGQSRGVLYNQMIQKKAFEPVFHIAEQYTLTLY